LSYSREDDEETITGGLPSSTVMELQNMGKLDCLSLLELPRLFVSLSFESETLLLLKGQPLLLVELGKAKGQKRFSDDLMVAGKTSLSCRVDKS
jgi:hypothetical protein